MKINWINLRTDLPLDSELLGLEKDCIVQAFAETHRDYLSHMDQFGAVQVFLERAEDHPVSLNESARRQWSLSEGQERSSRDEDYEWRGDSDRVKKWWRTPDLDCDPHRDALGLYYSHHFEFHRPAIFVFPRLILEATKRLYGWHIWPNPTDGFGLPFLWLVKSVAAHELAHAFMDGRYSYLSDGAVAFKGTHFDWHLHSKEVQVESEKNTKCDSCQKIFDFRSPLGHYYRFIEESLATAIQLRQILPPEGNRLVKALIERQPIEYRLSRCWQNLSDAELIETAVSWRKFKNWLVRYPEFCMRPSDGSDDCDDNLALGFLEEICGFLRRGNCGKSTDFYDEFVYAWVPRTLGLSDNFLKLVTLVEGHESLTLADVWNGSCGSRECDDSTKSACIRVLLKLIKCGVRGDFVKTATHKIERTHPWPELPILRRSL